MSSIQLVGTAEAARILNQSRANVHLLVSSGKLKPIARVGGKRINIFDKDDVERLAAARRGAKDA